MTHSSEARSSIIGNAMTLPEPCSIEHVRSQPRRVAGRALHVEELPGGPVGIPLHHLRAVAHVRDQERRDVGVVLEQVALRDAELGPERLAQVREGDVLAVRMHDRSLAVARDRKPSGLNLRGRVSAHHLQLERHPRCGAQGLLSLDGSAGPRRGLPAGDQGARAPASARGARPDALSLGIRRRAEERLQRRRDLRQARAPAHRARARHGGHGRGGPLRADGLRRRAVDRVPVRAVGNDGARRAKRSRSTSSTASSRTSRR